MAARASGSRLADANLNWVDCMNRLVRADLVFREEDRESDVYRFKHAITQEVAYEMLPRQRRRELHQRAAKAIEEHHRESLEQHCEALAFHYGVAEEHELAANYAEKSGDKAARTFSLEEARQHYRQAIACIDKLEPTDDRVRKRIAIGLKWAAACMFKPSNEQLDVLRTSLSLARRIGDSKAGAYTQSWLGSIEYALGDQQRATAEFVECMSIARELNDERLLAQLHLNLGQSHAAAAEYPKALEHLYEGLDLKAQVPSRRGGASGQSSSGVGRVLCPRLLGSGARRHGRIRSLLRLPRRGAHPRASGTKSCARGIVLTQMAMVQLWQGDWQACLATSAMMQRTAERVHGPYILAMSKTVSGYANFMLHPGDEGIEALTEAVAWLESTQIGLTMSWNRACLAEVLALSSRREEATAQASKALERLSAKDRLGEAAAHRALGIAAGIAGSWADAAPHFDRSLIVAARKKTHRAPPPYALSRRGSGSACECGRRRRSSRAGKGLAHERDHGLRQDEHAWYQSRPARPSAGKWVYRSGSPRSLRSNWRGPLFDVAETIGDASTNFPIQMLSPRALVSALLVSPSGPLRSPP